MERYVDHSVNKQAVKALVAVYGPYEAARQSGLPLGTIKTWCWRYKWKKAKVLPIGTGINGNTLIAGKDAAQALIDALQSHKEASTLNLAKFTEKASRKAAEHKDPLSMARNARDVAQVYKTVWPVEKEEGMIEEAILIGSAKVTDNPKEIFSNVREELPDQ
jgi:hypothetical protein